jgi:ADP-heptose:LPS heptosyltransferase/tetratricopeptide (TPR) repeat protein
LAVRCSAGRKRPLQAKNGFGLGCGSRDSGGSNQALKRSGLWRAIRRGGDTKRLLIDLAAAAQRQGRFRDAAALYVEVLQSQPGRGPIHVQAGHMFKEAGEYRQAEQHYRRAAELMPDDADLALQFGHFYKTIGRLDDAQAAYRRSAELAPDWDEPKKELENMRVAGWGPGAETGADLRRHDPAISGVELAGSYGVLAPERLPRPFSELIGRSAPSVTISQFGVAMNTFWGKKQVARGVEAIRGFCIETKPLVTVTALVNGLTLRRDLLKGPYELEYEADQEWIHKYVFNLWYDFTPFAPGHYTLELRFHDGTSTVRTHRQDFVVEPPLTEADHPDSDAVVTLNPDDARSVEEQINKRPSIVHEAVQTRSPARIDSILVMRTDQLGDMVVSVPAIRRLRELFPSARIVGLLGRANVDLARSLNLFDEVVAVDFRESMTQRTRTLDWAEQQQLREQLAAHRFDIAIDLATSVMSRPLLALSGAKFLYGFDDPAWPRLTASVDDAFHDPKTHREISVHSARILALIERLPLFLSSKGEVIRRDDLSREGLRALGVADEERYAVLHTGARIVFSRWTHYPALAERLHRDTDLKIVIFTDQADLRSTLSPEIAASDRIIIIDRQLPFDDFDAVLSFCSIYVGNDSGPKHLAALRGVPVVSIHSARINWREWGQEQTGAIVSRKLPCAGCSIYHDVDECGKDFVCVTAIGLDDVYAAVRRYV